MSDIITIKRMLADRAQAVAEMLLPGGRKEGLSLRFWSKVQIRDAEGCWEWSAYRNKWGYGTINAGGRGGDMLLAHRVSWELQNGEIPMGMIVRHKCDNPACVNPDHLCLGTHKDNMADMSRRGRHAPAAGSENPRAKLNDELVVAMRRLLDSGVSETVVAREFGVSRSLAGQIRRRERWNHV